MDTRDFLMAVGYWGKWLVAQNERGKLYISEETEGVREAGTICDEETIFVPVDYLPAEEYAAFCRGFLVEA